MGFRVEKIVKKWLAVLMIFSWNFTGVLYGAAYEKYVDEIVSSFIKDVQKEYDIVCIGSGGRMPKYVEEISLDFNAYRRADIEEVRELIVQLRTKLIERVNSHEKIRPFLIEYPFTWQGADISIAFQKPNTGSYYLDGSVAFVCPGRGGKIAYKRAELQKKTIFGMIDTVRNTVAPDRVEEHTVFVPLLEESYEEAVRIIQEKKKKDHDKID
ncbi:MAG: hypothetical protein JSR76_01050 [Verrucomicrobia bacterium]|nr:hypothetical protein [Verrucomicrobiota bacterium]